MPLQFILPLRLVDSHSNLLTNVILGALDDTNGSTLNTALAPPRRKYEVKERGSSYKSAEGLSPHLRHHQAEI